MFIAIADLFKEDIHLSTKLTIHEAVYMMTLYKKEDLRQFRLHNEHPKVEYVTFGCFDFMELKKVTTFNEILNIPETLDRGDSTVHSFSLFSCDDVNTPKFIEVGTNNYEIRDVNSNCFSEQHLRKNICLVSMIKLDSRILSQYANKKATDKLTGLDVLYAAKKSIENVVEKLHKNVTLKCFFSLSEYDLILFLSASNPNDAANSIISIRNNCPEITFTTSFFTFDYHRFKTWDDFKRECEASYGNIFTGLRLQASLRSFFDVNDLKRAVCDLLKIEQCTNVISGYIPGDEDVILAIERANCFNILSLYHPYRDNPSIKNLLMLRDESNKEFWILEKIRRLHSTFAYFDSSSIFSMGDSYEPSELSQSYFTTEEKEERITALKKLYSYVKDKSDSLAKKPNYPQITKYYVERILADILHLIVSGNHQNTAFIFLQLLENGFSLQELYIDDIASNAIKQSCDISPFAKFVCDMYLSLENIVKSTNVYMNKIIDLYPMNSYFKLLFAYKNMAKQIYNILPRFNSLTQSTTELELFLSIGQNPKFSGEQYFYFPKEIEANQTLSSINVPSPLFFDLSESYSHLLHEIAHIQYVNSGNLLNETLRDTILFYISTLICGELIARNEPCKSDDIYEKLINSPSIISLNEKCKSDRIKMAVYCIKLAEAIKDLELLICQLLYRDNIKNLTLQMFTSERCIDLITACQHSLIEARADILMILMSGSDFTSCDYINIWHRDSVQYDTNRINGDKSRKGFLLRCTLVLAYFAHKKKFNLHNADIDKLPEGGMLKDYYKKNNLIATPFIRYTKKIEQQIIDSDGLLNDRLSKKWTEFSITNNICPKKFNIQEHLAFYTNLWFEDLHDTEQRINKLCISGKPNCTKIRQ